MELSRTTRVDLHRAQVDLSKIAREILDDLQRDQPQPKVHISITAGIIVDADPQLIRVAMENPTMG